MKKLSYDSLPFVLQVLWHPIRALDLVDAAGKPDHGKVLPAILLGASIGAQYIGKPFSVGALIVLGSLAYGYGAWRTFLASKAATATEAGTVSWGWKKDVTQTSTETKAITERRDISAGIEPTKS